MNSTKDAHFILAAPSYVRPGTILENCLFLSELVREVGIVLFETAACLNYSDVDLPKSLNRLGLTFHVHLPLDLPWESSPSAVFRIIEHLLDKTGFLEPWGYVLHPPDNPEILTDFVRLWKRSGRKPQNLLLENIRTCDLVSLWNVIQDFDLGVCLDVGHLITWNQYELLHKPSFWDRVKMIHLYAPGPGHRHLPLSKLSPSDLDLVRTIIRRIPQGCVIMLEIFDEQSFRPSLAFASNLLTSRNCQ